MIIYRIRDWAKHFENHETRKLRSLSWVPIPNKLDGAGYRAIVAMPRAMEIFGAWVLILEVASRCPVRGTLEKDGVAFGPRELALKTGMPEQIYQVSLPALVSIGWIETCGESPGISRNLPESPGVPGETAAEGKGREGKGTEGKGTEEQQLLSATADAPAPVLTAKEFEMAWNSQVANVPKVKAWTAGRAAKLKTRLADPYWRENWRAALAKIGTSRFLQGDGSTGWRADVDWFLSPDSVARILEGKYDGNGTGTGRGNTGSRTFASAAEQAGKFDGR